MRGRVGNEPWRRPVGSVMRATGCSTERPGRRRPFAVPGNGSGSIPEQRT